MTEVNVNKTQQNPPFMKIPDAARFTGLSAHFLREGCKSGTVPHIKAGRMFVINIPRLLEQLGAN